MRLGIQYVGAGEQGDGRLDDRISVITGRDIGLVTLQEVLVYPKFFVE